MKKYINGVASEMTAEELTAFQNKQTEWQQEDAIRLAEEQAKVNAKVSGNQKLLDLGLTQAEATALTGYTPPVAE
jgi:CO dehydrogenase nickel-insertion accessory protein CooC1